MRGALFGIYGPWFLARAAEVVTALSAAGIFGEPLAIILANFSTMKRWLTFIKVYGHDCLVQGADTTMALSYKYDEWVCKLMRDARMREHVSDQSMLPKMQKDFVARIEEIIRRQIITFLPEDKPAPFEVILATSDAHHADVTLHQWGITVNENVSRILATFGAQYMLPEKGLFERLFRC